MTPSPEVIRTAWEELSEKARPALVERGYFDCAVREPFMLFEELPEAKPVAFVIRFRIDDVPNAPGAKRVVCNDLVLEPNFYG